MVVAYDGTELAGWQRQRNRPTAQGALEDALAVLMGRHVSVTGAGRTDAGVHATGQVAHFDITWQRSTAQLAAALNGNLPPALVVRRVSQVPQSFHARHGAVGRRYRYQIWQGPAQLPESVRGWLVVPERLVVPWLESAAALFEGVHDFRLFGRPVAPYGTTIRRVERCAVWALGPQIVLEVEANAFLRHQIRRMVALLLEVGRGRWAPEVVRDVLLGDRGGPQFGRAPAGGLTLTAVRYPPGQLMDLQPVA